MAPTPARPVPGKERNSPASEQKKFKKAALATTGYTGTARATAPPKAGASAGKGRSAEPRERPRYTGSAARSRKYNDYDEELDDFIDYDDEEDEAPGYGRRGEFYSEEEESDMEAGLSDIDEEERRAEREARREDYEEEALEKKLKREKEERRRQLAAERNRMAAKKASAS